MNTKETIALLKKQIELYNSLNEHIKILNYKIIHMNYVKITTRRNNLISYYYNHIQNIEERKRSKLNTIKDYIKLQYNKIKSYHQICFYPLS